MTDHPSQLFAVEFQPQDQIRLAGFSCGTEPWSAHVSEWLLGSDVLASQQRGTRVWLFETSSGEVVGFGSLGTSVWRWPPPSGARTTIVLIPMLGIEQRFQGQPPDPAWRYARQIMAHLLAEAQRMIQEWTGQPEQRPGWLVLLVHRDNLRARRFYERCGFEFIPDVVRSNDHLVMKIWLGS